MWDEPSIPYSKEQSVKVTLASPECEGCGHTSGASTLEHCGCPLSKSISVFLLHFKAFVYFSILPSPMCVSVCVCAHSCTTEHMWNAVDNFSELALFSSTMWGLGIKLRPAGLAAGAITGQAMSLVFKCKSCYCHYVSGACQFPMLPEPSFQHSSTYSFYPYLLLSSSSPSPPLLLLILFLFLLPYLSTFLYLLSQGSLSWPLPPLMEPVCCLCGCHALERLSQVSLLLHTPTHSGGLISPLWASSSQSWQ